MLLSYCTIYYTEVRHLPTLENLFLQISGIKKDVSRFLVPSYILIFTVEATPEHIANDCQKDFKERGIDLEQYGAFVIQRDAK